MNVRTLLPALLVLVLAACAAEPADESTAADAATETEAVYGDDAPVAIAAEPADDHGHAHDEAEGEHAHEDDAHDHDDSSAPHVH